MSAIAAVPMTQGRPGVRRKRNFSFNKGDLVLVKWADGMVYFAKIKHVYHRREKCVVVFDDKSQDEADFSQIHSVDETTTDIICIKCKKDDSELPNEIVLCDKCGIGFHQKCHNPIIPASALQLDSPWNCSYCQRGTKCPYLTESLDVLQNLLSDDNESVNEEEECNGVESEGDDNVVLEDSNAMNSEGTLKKKKSLRLDGRKTSTANDKKKNLRGSTPTAISSLATTERRSLPASKPQSDSPNHKDLSLSEEDDGTVVETVSASRKRKKYTPLHHKRQKRPSVESHTVSVTRLDSPIFADGTNTPPESNEKEEGLKSNLLKSKHERRSLRVSLSLPDEMDIRRNLKSPFSCNGDSVMRSASASPTAEAMKVSPSCDTNNPVTGFDGDMEMQVDGFTATALPVETTEENSVDPSSSSEVVSPAIMDVGVTSSTEQSSSVAVNSSVVINSCKSPTTEMPADSSTTSKCLSSVANSLVTATSSCKSVDLNLNVEEASKEKDSSMSDKKDFMDKNSAVAPIASDNADDAVIPVPTTLPVVIERSVCYPKNSDGLISPTKAIISSGDCACEAGDSSGAQLTPVSTSMGNFQIPQNNEVKDTCEAIEKNESVVSDTPMNSTDDKCLDEPDAIDMNSVSQNVGDEPKDTTPVSVQETQVDTSGSTSPVSTTPSAPTSVIATSSSTSKPQNHSGQLTSGDDSQMSKLDRELARVIGYEELEGLQGKCMKSHENVSDETQKQQASSNESVKSCTNNSEVLDSKPEEIGRNEGQTTNEGKAADTTGSVDAADPDVIITSVVPSKESNRRDSTSTQPSGWVMAHVSTSGPKAPIPSSQVAAEVLAGPSSGDKNKPPPPYSSHSAETSGIKSPTHPISVHAARGIYSSTSKVSMGYQSRGGSVIYTPNVPMYYASVQQDGSVPKQACVPNFPAGVATSKPYAIVNGVTPSSGDSPFPRGVEGGRHYVVYKDGVCQQVIPAPCTLTVPPDSTADAESTSGMLPPSTTTATSSSSVEKDKLPRRKFAPKDIQYIQKKVGDACNSYDVSMFMAAFNDAWQKFQANASNYQDQAVVTNSRLTLGQAPDGSQQVHLVSTKPRVVAPKLSSSTTESGTNSTSSPTFLQIHPTSTQKQQQQQYLVQHVASAPHYAPVYAVPGPSHHHACAITSSNKAGCPPSQATVSTPIPHVQSEKNSTSVAQSLPTSPMAGHNKAPRMAVNHFKTKPMGQAKPATKSGPLPNKKQKNCSRCGKPATYLCSGCRKEWYCSKECQLTDWVLHSKRCTP